MTYAETVYRMIDASPRAVAGRSTVEADESELIQAVQAGSADAASALVERYWDEAYRAAALIVVDRGTAEDLAQESMLSAIRSIGGFDSSRPFLPWLRRLVANRAVDHLRSPLRRITPSESVEPIQTDLHDSSDAALAAALLQLTPDDRTMVVLRYVLDYTAAEIGVMHELPASTVRSRLRRGLEKLRRTYNEGEA